MHHLPYFPCVDMQEGQDNILTTAQEDCATIQLFGPQQIFAHQSRIIGRKEVDRFSREALLPLLPVTISQAIGEGGTCH